MPKQAVAVQDAQKHVAMDRSGPFSRISTPIARICHAQRHSRHDTIVGKAPGMVEYVNEYKKLVANLLLYRDHACSETEAGTEKKVEGIARWAGQSRLDKKIYRSGKTEVKMPTLPVDVLIGNTSAQGLHVVLCKANGHSPGQAFTLDHQGMKAAEPADSPVRASGRTRGPGACGPFGHRFKPQAWCHWPKTHPYTAALGKRRPDEHRLLQALKGWSSSKDKGLIFAYVDGNPLSSAAPLAALVIAP